MKWIFIFLFGVFTSLFVLLYWRLGLGKEVFIKIAERGPYYLVYKMHKGSYHKMNLTLESVEAWAKSENLKCEKTFGYYLDPEGIEEDRLKSFGGCLFERKPHFLSQKPVWSVGSANNKLNTNKTFFKRTKNISFMLWPKKKYIIANFSGSPSIAPFKVYPKIYKMAQDKRLGINPRVMEVYQPKGKSQISSDFLFEIR